MLPGVCAARANLTHNMRAPTAMVSEAEQLR